MSFDVYLEDEHGNVLPTLHLAIGGTYAVGGPRECWLNITCNYAPLWRLGDGGLRAFTGQRAADTIPALEREVRRLGGVRDDADYWAATPGNAGAALAALLIWAREHPEGVWRVE